MRVVADFKLAKLENLENNLMFDKFALKDCKFKLANCGFEFTIFIEFIEFFRFFDFSNIIKIPFKI